jgi:hypothetical protein
LNEQKFNRIVEDLNEYIGVEEVFLLNSEGNIIFTHGNYSISTEEAKNLLNSWKNKEGSISYQNCRFANIKNEEIQLAAKNTVDDKGNIAGSITNEGDYLIAHIAKETDIILLEWSILVNKLAWD